MSESVGNRRGRALGALIAAAALVGSQPGDVRLQLGRRDRRIDVAARLRRRLLLEAGEQHPGCEAGEGAGPGRRSDHRHRAGKEEGTQVSHDGKCTSWERRRHRGRVRGATSRMGQWAVSFGGPGRGLHAPPAGDAPQASPPKVEKLVEDPKVRAQLRDAVFARVRYRAMRRLSNQVLSHLHDLSLRYHLERRTGNITRDLERGTSSVSQILNYLVFNILPTTAEFLLVAMILLGKYEWHFALVTFATVDLVRVSLHTMAL